METEVVECVHDECRNKWQLLGLKNIATASSHKILLVRLTDAFIKQVAGGSLLCSNVRSKLAGVD
jgi:hypothetical protein